MGQGRLPDAIARARDALERGIEAPLLLNLRAYWLEGQNRPEDALMDLERARTLAPNDPSVLNALGLCLARLGRAKEALAAFEKCAEAAPAFAPARFNCGWTLEDLGELDRARQAFEEATRLDPSSPDPWARLASLAARRGRWDEAKSFAEKALARNPSHASAAIVLADVELTAKSYAASEARLRALIDAGKAGLRDRAVAMGLLGDIYDARGRFHDAFAAYEESNRLFQSAFADSAAIRAEIPMGEYVRWLLQSFASASPAELRVERPAASASDNARRLVFVLGFPRSGTTLLEEILACHPDVATTGEKDALSPIVRELFANPDQLERLKSLGPNELAPYRERYWEGIEKFGALGRVTVDKQPLNSVRLPLIVKLFPEAKIVFCLRDPRDVVLSCFRRRFTPNASNMEFLTLSGAAHLYDTVMNLVETYKKIFGVPAFEIRNEQLVDDFESTVRALCSYVGLDWVDEFRNFASRSGAREVATPSAIQIQRGLGREGIGYWRNYKAEMAPVLALLNGWAARLSYPNP